MYNCLDRTTVLEMLDKWLSDFWLWLFYPESISVLSSQISVIHPRRGGSRSERRGVALRPDKIQQCNTISSKENFKNVLKIIITK
jgi:hypothetical protein